MPEPTQNAEPSLELGQIDQILGAGVQESKSTEPIMDFGQLNRETGGAAMGGILDRRRQELMASPDITDADAERILGQFQPPAQEDSALINESIQAAVDDHDFDPSSYALEHREDPAAYEMARRVWQARQEQGWKDKAGRAFARTPEIAQGAVKSLWNFVKGLGYAPVHAGRQAIAAATGDPNAATRTAETIIATQKGGVNFDDLKAAIYGGAAGDKITQGLASAFMAGPDGAMDEEAIERYEAHVPEYLANAIFSAREFPSAHRGFNKDESLQRFVSAFTKLREGQPLDEAEKEEMDQLVYSANQKNGEGWMDDWRKRKEFDFDVDQLERRNTLNEGVPLDEGFVANTIRMRGGEKASELFGPKNLASIGAEPVNQATTEELSGVVDPVNIATLRMPFLVPGARRIGGAIVEGAGRVGQIAKAVPGGKMALSGAAGGALLSLGQGNPELAGGIALVAAGAYGLKKVGQISQVLAEAGRAARTGGKVAATATKELASARLTGQSAKKAWLANLVGNTTVDAATMVPGMAPINAVTSGALPGGRDFDLEKFIESELSAPVFGVLSVGNGIKPQLVEAIRPQLRAQGQEAMARNRTDLGKRSQSFIAGLPEAQRNAIYETAALFEGVEGKNERGEANESQIYVLGEADYKQVQRELGLPEGGRGFAMKDGKVYINGQHQSARAPGELAHTTGHEAGGHQALNILRAMTGKDGNLFKGLMAEVRKELGKTKDGTWTPSPDFQRFIDTYNAKLPAGARKLRADSPDAMEEFLSETAGQVISAKGAPELVMPEGLRDKIQRASGTFFGKMLGFDNRKIGTATHFNREESGAITSAYMDAMRRIADVRFRPGQAETQADPGAMPTKPDSKATAPEKAPVPPMETPVDPYTDLGIDQSIVDATRDHWVAPPGMEPSTQRANTRKGIPGKSADKVAEERGAEFDAAAKAYFDHLRQTGQEAPKSPLELEQAIIEHQLSTGPALPKAQAPTGLAGMEEAKAPEAKTSDLSTLEERPTAKPEAQPEPSRQEGLATLPKINAEEVAQRVESAQEKARESAGGKKSAQKEIDEAATDELMNVATEVAEEGDIRKTQDEFGDEVWRGTLRPENPVHRMLLDRAGIEPGSETESKLVRLQNSIGKTVFLRKYGSAAKKVENEAEGMGYSQKQRAEEQAESTADQRARRKGDDTKVEGEFVEQDKSFIPLYQEVTSTGKILVGGISPDKLVSNAKKLMDFAASERIDVGYSDINDPQLVQDVRAYAQNHANGWKGDGSRQIEGATVNPDYTPVEIPKNRFDLLNAAFKYESSTASSRYADKSLAYETGKTQGKKGLRKPQLTDKAKAREASAHGLALENMVPMRMSGEVNAFRDLVNRSGRFEVTEGGKTRKGTQEILEDVIEVIRPDLIGGEIETTQSGQEGGLRGSGFKGDLSKMTEAGMPHGKYVAAGFMPDADHNIELRQKEQALRDASTLSLGSKRPPAGFDTGFHMNKIAARILNDYATDTALPRMIEGAKKRGDTEAVKRHEEDARKKAIGYKVLSDLLADLAVSLPDREGVDMVNPENTDPFSPLKKAFPGGKKRDADSIVQDLANLTTWVHPSTRGGIGQNVLNVGDLLGQYGVPLQDSTKDTIMALYNGKTAAQQAKDEADFWNEMSPEFYDKHTNEGVDVYQKIDPDADGLAKMMPDSERTPKYKSLWLDRSGNVKGVMREQGHADIAKDLPEGATKAMIRGRVVGNTLHFDSANLTPAQRKFAQRFAEEHGLKVKANDRIIIDPEAQFMPEDLLEAEESFAVDRIKEFKNERGIKSAAIKMPDGDIIEGFAHATAFWEAKEQGYTDEDIEGATTGFVDGSGKFLTRDEARERAISLGQVNRPQLDARLDRDGTGFLGMTSEAFNEQKGKKDLSGMMPDEEPKDPSSKLSKMSEEPTKPKTNREIINEAMAKFDAGEIDRRELAKIIREHSEHFMPDTPEFNKWFKGSKVVDKEGRPLRLFHGGSFNVAEDGVFSPWTHFGTKNSALDRVGGKVIDDAISSIETFEQDGQWFFEVDGTVYSKDGPDDIMEGPGWKSAEDAQAAAEQEAIRSGEYREVDDDAANLTEVYLNLKNPIRLPDLGMWGIDDVIRNLPAEAKLTPEERARVNELYATKSDKAGWDELTSLLQGKGFDGVVYKNLIEDKGKDSYIAFDSKSIKSATDNSGDFDPENPDIRMMPETKDLSRLEEEPKAKQTSKSGLAALGSQIKPEEIEVNGRKIQVGREEGTGKFAKLMPEDENRSIWHSGAARNLSKRTRNVLLKHEISSFSDLRKALESGAAKKWAGAGKTVLDEAKTLLGDDAKMMPEEESELKRQKFFLGKTNPLISEGLKRDEKEPVARHNAKVEVLNILEDNGALTDDALDSVRDWDANDLESRLWEVGEKRTLEEIESGHEGEKTPEEWGTSKGLFEWVEAGHPETDEIKLAGYVLPDGKMLNFSHDGRQRDQDHREINWPGSSGGTEKMIAMMNAGAMRIDANSGNISLRRPPTGAQERAILEIVDLEGTAYIDAEAPSENGWDEKDRLNIEVEPENSDRALKKIRAFFNKHRNKEVKMMPDDVEPPDRKYTLRDLPRDMRENIFNEYAVFVNPEATERDLYNKRVPSGWVSVENLKISRIPSDQLDSYRKTSMVDFPPIVIADGKLIDGQHRIALARERGIKRLRYIDISGLTNTDPIEGAGHISELPKGKGEKLMPDTPFFSQLEKVTEEKIKGRATAEQIQATLRNNGVKQEELDWVLGDFLRAKAGQKITPEELSEAIQANQVELKEVTKGSKATTAEVKETKDGWGVFEDGKLIAEFQYQGEAEKEAENMETPLSKTKFSQYQLPGGENYREFNYVLPRKSEKLKFTIRKIEEPGTTKGWWELLDQDGEQRAASPNKVYIENSKKEWEEMGAEKYQKGHENPYRVPPAHQYGDEADINRIFHARVNDRTASDGTKLLFAEEIQSDWHQKGRKEGYKDEAKKKANQEKFVKLQEELFIYQKLSERASEVTPEEMEKFSISRDIEYADIDKKIFALQEEMRELQETGSGAVPNAPFKGHGWKTLALKKLLAKAVEEGKGAIGWTTGEQQAERYDLSKQLDTVELLKKSTDGTYTILGTPKGESAAEQLATGVKTEDLADYIGKELAAKVDQEAKSQEFSGVDLKVGGEGMKGFYDKELVNIANDLGKKYGAKVEKSSIQGEATENGSTFRIFPSKSEATKWASDNLGDHDFTVKANEGGLGGFIVYDEWSHQFVKPIKDFEIWTLPITEKLKAAIQAGQALFMPDADPVKKATKPFDINSPYMGGTKRDETRMVPGVWMTRSGDIIPIERDHNSSAAELLGLDDEGDERVGHDKGLQAGYKKGWVRVTIRNWGNKGVALSGPKLTPSQRRNIKAWAEQHGHEIEDYTGRFRPDGGYFMPDAKPASSKLSKKATGLAGMKESEEEKKKLPGLASMRED